MRTRVDGSCSWPAPVTDNKAQNNITIPMVGILTTGWRFPPGRLTEGLREFIFVAPVRRDRRTRPECDGETHPGCRRKTADSNRRRPCGRVGGQPRLRVADRWAGEHHYKKRAARQ